MSTLSGQITPTNIVTASGAIALTNKTVSLSNNTLTGTLAQFNAAVSDADLASLAGSETLTNKTIAYASNTLTGVQPTLVSGTSIKTINSTSLLGSGDLLIGSSVIRVARTSNTILGTSNNGNLIDITSGTFTQTFTAAATLGSGWFCYIRNSGTGDITLDPNASETIDGLTSYVMYPGEVRLVQCDGSVLRTVVLNSFYRTFTASGTFTKPPGYSAFQGLLWGGGAGGSKAATQTAGGGGGACTPFTVESSALFTSTSVTIGAGGTSTSVSNSIGGVGGNSQFGSVYAFGGGAAGPSGATQYGGGGGGALSAGASSTSGNGGDGGKPDSGSAASNRPDSGFGGGSGSSATGGASFYGGGGGAYRTGGASFYGGGGGSGTDTSTTYVGGASVYGGFGGSGNDTASGEAGVAPGGGGGGTRTGASSGSGARGELRIWGVI